MPARAWLRSLSSSNEPYPPHAPKFEVYTLPWESIERGDFVDNAPESFCIDGILQAVRKLSVAFSRRLPWDGVRGQELSI